MSDSDKFKEISGTILKQLGGNKFIAMTGAKNFYYDKYTTTFKIGRNSKSVNTVRITLNAMDTYDVDFMRVSFGTKQGYREKIISSHKGIYAEDLREVFESSTEMYTSLGSMFG